MSGVRFPLCPFLCEETDQTSKDSNSFEVFSLVVRGLKDPMALKLQTQHLVLEGHPFSISLPADQEEMLQLALAGEASGTTDWDPYWGLLWAAAPKTAELILRRNWPARLRSIELGCGIGLTGIAAMKAGLNVTFADHSSSAVSMALENVKLNQLPDARG